jgi:hypothetical protein
MPNLTDFPQTRFVSDPVDLVQSPFGEGVNAFCWPRKLPGDFAEIVAAFELEEDLLEIGLEELAELNLSPLGQIARATLVLDFEILQVAGAQPTINLLREYPRDTANPVFPTDVYSFHVDRAPVPTSTFLCTYFGAASEILPHTPNHARAKWTRPDIQSRLRQVWQEECQSLDPAEVLDFESFVRENCYDLHFEALPGAPIQAMQVGHLWRLAVDHPHSPVLPCIHRAPAEGGLPRLMLIC